MSETTGAIGTAGHTGIPGSAAAGPAGGVGPIAVGSAGPAGGAGAMAVGSVGADVGGAAGTARPLAAGHASAAGAARAQVPSGHSTGESGHGSPHRLDTIVRYTANDRTNHWLTAIAFVLAALSGLALFHPALFGLSSLFGGGPWTRILHPFIGLFMVLAFTLLAIRFWSHNFMQARDWQWMRQIRDVVDNREDRLPEVGKYNAGQKLLFWVLLSCLVGLLASGIVIWRAYFAFYFPIDGVRAASIVHAVCAFVLICSIIVHIYAAIWVKGSVHAMLRGTVTPGWAYKHHRAWYREMIHAANSRSRSD